VKRAASAQRTTFLERALWLTIAAFTLIIPAYVSPHADNVFRLPKELLLRAEGVVVAAIVAMMLIWQPRRLRSLLLDRVTATALGACAVATLLSAALSTNRAISVRSVGYVLACIVVFWATYIAVGRQSVRRAVLIGAAAAIANALLAITQRLDWFNPFEFENLLMQRMRTTAFIGNPNDVGASLAVSLVVVTALAILNRSAIAAGAALLLFSGVLAADALTAILAVAAALAGMLLLASRRAGLRTIAAIVLLSMATVAVYPPLRTRMNAMAAAARARDYDALTSHRIVGFLVALKIFGDHPVTGAGPGTFKWLYLPYRLQVESEYPRLYLKIVQNVAEVHSDHLQILAEEGALGYGAMLFAAVALGSRSWILRKRNGELDERAKFVHVAALPLAVCFLVLAVAGFPLELAAVTTPLLFFAACILRWSHDATAD